MNWVEVGSAEREYSPWKAVVKHNWERPPRGLGGGGEGGSWDETQTQPPPPPPAIAVQPHKSPSGETIDRGTVCIHSYEERTRSLKIL